MPSKNKVTFTAENVEGGVSNIAGGIIGGNQKPGQESANVLNVNLKNMKNSQTNVSGSDISIGDKSLEPLLKELVEILVLHLPEKNQKEDLHEVANEVLEQGNKPPEEKNLSKIQRLLNSLGGYIGLTTVAVTQAEHIKMLFESIQKLLLGH